MKRIYLDNNATTALDRRVLNAMLADLEGGPANPSSVHRYGRDARQKLQQARQAIANYLNIPASEILFTSGGTEGINLLLRGFFSRRGPGKILTSNVEHACVYETVRALGVQGCRTHFLPSGVWGAVQPEALEETAKDADLIVLGAANGETGVRIDLEEIAAIADRQRVPLVIDGVALLGKAPFQMPKGVSAMVFSAHKIHGPKGVGFCIVKPSFTFDPLLTGGDQEYSKRAGTENLSGILGLAKAVELIDPAAMQRMEILRNHFENTLKERIPGVAINGEGPRVGNTSNLSFGEMDGETLLIQLDQSGIAASHGSACSSGALEPSRVLTSMGFDKKRARSSVRFSLSRMTTEEEIAAAIETVASICHQSGYD